MIWFLIYTDVDVRDVNFTPVGTFCSDCRINSSILTCDCYEHEGPKRPYSIDIGSYAEILLALAATHLSLIRTLLYSNVNIPILRKSQNKC